MSSPTSMKRFFIAAGVIGVLILPVGTMGVATISSPARLERFVASIPPEVKAWAKVAWQVLKEGRSVPVMMIDAVARAIPNTREVVAERNGKRLLDDGGDVMLTPILIHPASARLPRLPLLPQLRGTDEAPDTMLNANPRSAQASDFDEMDSREPGAS